MQSLSGDAVAEGMPVIPIGLRLRQSIYDVPFQPQGLPDVTECALRAIANYRRGDRRAVAPVFLEEVLDYFLSSLMLEIDVDVRRFVALLADEAFEKHLDQLRIHFRDFQGVTHDGIRGGAASLAQDRLRPASRPGDDLMHRQKEMLVAQLFDELQLPVHRASDFLWHCVRPALAESLFSKVAQMFRRRCVLRRQFARIVITQNVQGEFAALCDAHSLLEKIRRINRRQILQAPQMALTIRKQPMTCVCKRTTVSNRSNDILQRPSFSGMHMNIARREQRQADRLTEPTQR